MFNLKQFFMQKKNLFASAFLCASMFLFTGCDKIMSHFDNSVDSNLKVADKLTIIGVGETYQIAKDVDYKTISDADPSFESLDKAIATVEPKTGLVTALKSGDARIKISLPDNGLYLDASAIISIKVRVHNTDQFYKNVEALADEDQILFAEDAAVEMAKVVDLSGKKIAIKGVENKPAKITIQKEFTVNNSFEVSNVEFDASGFVYNSDAKKPPLNKAIIQLADLPEGTTQIDIDAIKFDNVVVKSLDASLINCYGSSKKYFIKNLTINNSIIGLGGSKYVLDFQNGGNIADITISKSTLWPPSTKKHTSRIFQNQSAATISSLGGSTFTYTIENSTLYNISNNHNYVNYLRQNNQTWITYNVKNNIIVDCQRSGSFIRGINGNSNDNDCKCTWNVDNNMINYGGSDVSATEVTNMNSTKYADKNPRVKNCIAGTVTFADADKGDFSQTGVNAGDPRWKK